MDDDDDLVCLSEGEEEPQKGDQEADTVPPSAGKRPAQSDQGTPPAKKRRALSGSQSPEVIEI